MDFSFFHIFLGLCALPGKTLAGVSDTDIEIIQSLYSNMWNCHSRAQVVVRLATAELEFPFNRLKQFGIQVILEQVDKRRYRLAKALTGKIYQDSVFVYQR